MSNIASGRQLRAARIMAGLTQAELARSTGHHTRAVRYWEAKNENMPTCISDTLQRIEEALLRHGVMVFASPTPGVGIIKT